MKTTRPDRRTLLQLVVRGVVPAELIPVLELIGERAPRAGQAAVGRRGGANSVTSCAWVTRTLSRAAMPTMSATFFLIPRPHLSLDYR